MGEYVTCTKRCWMKIELTKEQDLIARSGEICGNDLYLYLLDNEDFGACKRLIKSGRYELERKYQFSNGMDIFVIDKFKECKEPTEE